MDEFNRPGSDVFVYLLTTRAGVSFFPASVSNAKHLEGLGRWNQLICECHFSMLLGITF